MQTTAQIGIISSNHQRKELDDFLNNEAGAEMKAEQLAQRAKDLMQPGQEFYPWTFKNFTEAIENSPQTDCRIMFEFISAAVDKRLLSDNFNHSALVKIKNLVEQYWEKNLSNYWRKKNEL